MTTLFGHGPDVLSTTWTGPFSSRDEAVQHGRSVYGKTHSFYIIRGEALRVEDFVPKPGPLTQFLLDEIWSEAFDKHGDHADVFPDACDVGDTAQAELHMIVKSWVQRRLKNGWVPTGDAVRVEPLTQLALAPSPVPPYRTASQKK